MVGNTVALDDAAPGFGADIVGHMVEDEGAGGAMQLKVLQIWIVTVTTHAFRVQNTY